MEGKKIIFFLPTLSVGGGERVASDLSLNLPASFETAMVLFKNQVSYPYKGKLFCLNIPISINWAYRIFFFFVAVFRLKKIIKKEQPDYVISFGIPAGIINAVASKKTIIRVDNFLSTYCNLPYKILIRLFFKNSPLIMCVSKKIAQDMVENFGVKAERIKVLYNPLNIEEIKNLASESLEPKYQKIFENPVVITVGRMTRQKSQEYLILAFKRVKEAVKDAQLVILGKGELEPELRQLAKDSGLEDCVHFFGWQNNPFKFLAKSKVFVLSSLWEGLPCVILEAMACGLPVISTDCKSGPREILAPKTDINHEAKSVEYEEFGALVPPKLPEGLAKATIEVLTNKKLAASLAARSRQRAEAFEIKNIIKAWDFLCF